MLAKHNYIIMFFSHCLIRSSIKPAADVPTRVICRLKSEREATQVCWPNLFDTSPTPLTLPQLLDESKGDRTTTRLTKALTLYRRGSMSRRRGL